MLDVIEKYCEICIKYKKPSLKPAVRFLLSKEFNVISMDLKHINGITFLHIVDNITAFSATAVVKSKHQEEIVDIFIRHWIAIFGAPGMIISDSGGEFNNRLFTNMVEVFNINVKSTVVSKKLMQNNSLHNCYGYSPNQLFYGHNSSLPPILTNELPSMEDNTNELLK